MFLQKTVGNQAVQRLLQSSKKASASTEELEQEADRLAAQVMATPPPPKSPEELAPLPAASNFLLKLGPGVPLPTSERKFFEARLGHDLSRVRLHTGPEAAVLARQADALAFTAGRDLVFDPGSYSPATPSGRLLLAHELAHVLQSQQNPAEGARLRKKKTSAAKFYQEVIDAIRKDEKEMILPGGWRGIEPTSLSIRRKLLKLCLAVEKGDKHAIPGLLDDFIKANSQYLSINTLSEKLALELAARLYNLELTKESEKLRRHAFARFAEGWGQAGTIGEADVLRKYQAEFWDKIVRDTLMEVKLTDTPAASASLDRLLRVFADIRDILTALPQKRGTGQTTAHFGLEIPEYSQELQRLLGVAFTGIQKIFQHLMDLAVAELEAGKGHVTLDLIQSILETKILNAIFPQDRAKWAGGIEVAVTRSVFHKHGGLYLDFFLKGKAARKRSAAFTFYDLTGESGEEKTLSFERIYKIRQEQIAFLKRLYGAPEKGVVSAEGKANLAVISKMIGKKFHLHSNDDWREFLLLKYKDLLAQGLSKTEIIIQIVDLLQAYLHAFTLHTPYNIYDEGPDNYLEKDFPRALTGQLLHDCGVYALRITYILSLVRREMHLLFRFVYLPAHVGLIITGEDLPIFIAHNDVITVIKPDEAKKLRTEWQAWRMPVAPGKEPPGPADEAQFLGEMAAALYIPGPLDMPFRLVTVPAYSGGPKALKAKLWKFYKEQTYYALFGPEARKPGSDVYQIRLAYLSLIQQFKNIYNDKVIYFWNILAHQAWLDVESYVQHEAVKGTLLSGEALGLLKGYRHRLAEAFKPIAEDLKQLDKDKEQLTKTIHEHPKLTKKSIPLSIGLRAATLSHNIFEQEYRDHLKKVDACIARLKLGARPVSISPILKDITPPFATEKGFKEPID